MTFWFRYDYYYIWPVRKTIRPERSTGLTKVAEMGFYPKNLTPEPKLSTSMLCWFLIAACAKTWPFCFWYEDVMEQTRGQFLIQECLQHLPRQEAGRSSVRGTGNQHATEMWKSFYWYKENIVDAFFIGICVSSQRSPFPPCITSFIRAGKPYGKDWELTQTDSGKILLILCHLDSSLCEPWNLSYTWFLHLQNGHNYHHFIGSLWGFQWGNICKEICKVL